MSARVAEPGTARPHPPAGTTGDAPGGGSTQPRRALVLGGLAVALLVAVVLAVGIGAAAVSPAEVVAVIAARLGLDTGALPDATRAAVVWEIRLPRVLLAVLVGAGLGVAGTLLQGMFRNPLAEPGIIGVSAGAAAGAVAAIVLGVVAGPFGVAAAAFVGGVGTTFLVYAVARTAADGGTVTIVLAGIAVNAVAGALIGVAMFVSDDAQLRSITFWNLGSVGAATWQAVAVVAPVVALGTLAALRVAGQLDLLALGEGAARHLGVDVDHLRAVLVVVVAATASAAVAVAGIIAFVGLVVPHLLRLTVGPRHGLLVPASALGGGLLLVVADLVARTVAAPAEVPLGALTGLLGGPFFFWLLLRRRAGAGGWR